ncbi:MAG: THUMP domain-containing protein [Bacteroidetes bacterium]|nr:THUMP domain-containing protein [Bacteroidota bacterium]
MEKLKLVVKTSFGLEDILLRELTDLGAQKAEKGIRVVTVEGDQRLMYKINLCSRVALRVLQPVKKFRVGNEQQLYDEIKKIDWSKYMSVDGTLAVDAVVNKSVMTHSLYVALKTKDAIVDQFRDNTGKRPNVDLVRPSLRIHLHINGEDAEVSLDSSGDSLHKRGYRMQTGDAPINEALAAGLILLSEWDRKSPFLDFMCGSGTILIEAAMMALNIAPGSLRKEFGFQRWNDFNEKLWSEVKAEAAAAQKSEIDFPITGVDLNTMMITYAKENAEAAKVLKYITFKQMSFDDYVPDSAPGIILINPPYGGRITTGDILALYKSMGDQFKKKYPGWKGFVFTANMEAGKNIGLKPSRKIPLFNGKLECRLLKFEMYAGTKRQSDVQV